MTESMINRLNAATKLMEDVAQELRDTKPETHKLTIRELLDIRGAIHDASSANHTLDYALGGLHKRWLKITRPDLCEPAKIYVGDGVFAGSPAEFRAILSDIDSTP